MTNSQATNPLTYDPQWSQAATRKDAGLVAWEPLHHNPQSSFARRFPLGAAEGRQAGSPPPGLPTTIIHHDHQMTPHSKGWGNPLGTSCAETLAGRQGRGRVLTVGDPRFVSQTGDAFGSAFIVQPPLTRRLLLSERSRHFFRVRVGSSRRSAINHALCNRTFHRLCQGLPSHFKFSFVGVNNTPRKAEHVVPETRVSGTSDDR